MSNIIIFSIIVVFPTVIGIFAWLYLFNIYEVKISLSPKLTTINFNSKIEINVIPLNSFGKRALLRNITSNFEIVSGANLVKVIDKTPDKIIIQSLRETGKVEILVTPKIGLFSTKVGVKISV